MEAAWAITNAIHGANADQIKYVLAIICEILNRFIYVYINFDVEFLDRRLKKSCVGPLWNSLKLFSDNLDILSACLEGLVRLEGVEIACNGALIDDVELKKCLVTLRGRQFQFVDDDNDVDELPKSKKLRTTDNIGKYDGDVELHLTCTSKEGATPELLTI